MSVAVELESLRFMQKPRTEQKYLFSTPHGDNGWPYHFVACAGRYFKSEPGGEFLQGPATKAPAGSRTLHI